MSAFRLASAPTSAALRSPSVLAWTVAVFLLFLVRGVLFSTWFSRGPDVQQLLGINTVQLGLAAMLVPLGGLLAIGPASTLVHRFGTCRVAVAGHLVATVSLDRARFRGQ